MAIKVQLALQGGGAKIFGLLAVMEALQESTEKGEIEITRIAGTSAGAIIAVLMAAGCRAATIKLQLKPAPVRKALLAMFPKVTRMEILLMALLNRPLRSQRKLRNLLRAKLKEVGLEELTFEALRKKKGIPIKIVASDLTNAKAKVFEAEKDSVLDAVLHSCGLPFYFRLGGSQDVLVDGGLLENFPLGVLADGNKDEFGTILGVGFAEPDRDPPESLTAFSLSLFDASMTHSMRRAREQIAKESIIDIKTDVGTLDFEGALSVGMDHEYEVIRLNAIQSITQFVARVSRGEVKVVPPTVELSQLKRQIAKVYEVVEGNERYKHEQLRWEIQANTLASAERPDEREWRERPDLVKYRYSFRPTAVPLKAISVAVTPTPNKAEPARATVGWEDVRHWKLFNALNKPVDVIDVALSAESPREGSRVILWFNPPIKPGQTALEPYSLVFRDIGVGTTDALLHARRDVFALEFPRADGVIDRAEIALHLPRSISRVRMVQSLGKGIFPGRQMEDGEVRMSFETPVGFNTFVWCGERIPGDQSLSVDVEIGL